MAEFFYGASPKIFERAKELRMNITSAEFILWKKLKARQIFGLQFRRQHPINQFISDFYCHKVLLVIEVDGEIHLSDQQIERDQGRDYFMNELGLTVLRFTNEQVIHHIKNVVEKIKHYCNLNIAKMQH